MLEFDDYPEVAVSEVKFQFSIGDAVSAAVSPLAFQLARFNSLLEMPHRDLSEGEAERLVAVSILYWRCGVSALSRNLGVTLAVSILYWRCSLGLGRGPLPPSLKRFNSLLEMRD